MGAMGAPADGGGSGMVGSDVAVEERAGGDGISIALGGGAAIAPEDSTVVAPVIPSQTDAVSFCRFNAGVNCLTQR